MYLVLPSVLVKVATQWRSCHLLPLVTPLESSIYLDERIMVEPHRSREMFAIEQVEVTKGSASTLGGGGTVGGSI